MSDYQDANPQPADSFRSEEKGEESSSKLICEAIDGAEDYFKQYNAACDEVDKYYDATMALVDGRTGTDNEFDLFWASMEIVNPSVYAQAPRPVVSPRFNDRNPVVSTACEIMERCLTVSFELGGIDEALLNVRDDLVLNNRGVARVVYEDDNKQGKRLCYISKDRCDFLHEPGRSWAEVGWVAYGEYLTERQMRERFSNVSAAELSKASYYANGKELARNERYNNGSSTCKVWEVWHRRDGKVYWVTKGVDVILDEKPLFLHINGGFTCAKPAYGTLKRRSLIPIPDFFRVSPILDQINSLTSRIYDLLGWVRLRGIIPATGDVSTAVTTMMSQNDESVMLIPVPQASFASSAGKFIEWVPIDMIATTITGLLEARAQLMQNFYEVSGISDIMRGATAAEETLGAQQLKQQNGSIRVRKKVEEMQRYARDLASMSAEIIAQKFPLDAMLEMAQMELPREAAIKRSLKEMEANAKKELDDLAKAMEEQADELKAKDELDEHREAEMQEAFQKQQQAIIGKYQPQIASLQQSVTYEAVKELLDDKKERAFAIDIETDSTILKDEMQEKASRNEFLQAFSNASQALIPLTQAGPEGKQLAGGIMKFALAPYRVGRTLDGLIDDFIEKGQTTPEDDGSGEDQATQQALAQAQTKLAEAENVKAQAAVMQAETKRMKDQSDSQAKIAKLQQDAQDNERKAGLEIEKLRASVADGEAKVRETNAKIDLIYAQIEAMGGKRSVDQQKADNETARTAADIEDKRFNQEMASRPEVGIVIEGQPNGRAT